MLVVEFRDGTAVAIRGGQEADRLRRMLEDLIDPNVDVKVRKDKLSGQVIEDS